MKTNRRKQSFTLPSFLTRRELTIPTQRQHKAHSKERNEACISSPKWPTSWRKQLRQKKRQTNADKQKYKQRPVLIFHKKKIKNRWKRQRFRNRIVENRNRKHYLTLFLLRRVKRKLTTDNFPRIHFYHLLLMLTIQRTSNLSKCTRYHWEIPSEKDGENFFEIKKRANLSHEIFLFIVRVWVGSHPPFPKPEKSNWS